MFQVFFWRKNLVNTSEFSKKTKENLRNCQQTKENNFLDKFSVFGQKISAIFQFLCISLNFLGIFRVC